MFLESPHAALHCAMGFNEDVMDMVADLQSQIREAKTNVTFGLGSGGGSGSGQRKRKLIDMESELELEKMSLVQLVKKGTKPPPLGGLSWRQIQHGWWPLAHGQWASPLAGRLITAAE